MQVITYQEGDSVAVVIPNASIPIEVVAAKDVPEGVPFTIIDASQLPDRYFRAAWEFDGPKGTKVNVEKAKEVQRNVWRKLREKKLAALDVEFMQAVEGSNSNKLRQVSERKQALRDVTQGFIPDDLAQIKNFIPDTLI